MSLPPGVRQHDIPGFGLDEVSCPNCEASVSPSDLEACAECGKQGCMECLADCECERPECHMKWVHSDSACSRRENVSTGRTTRKSYIAVSCLRANISNHQNNIVEMQDQLAVMQRLLDGA